MSDINPFYDFFNVIMINLILSGDNAVVIALTVKSLPHEYRKKGLILASGFAVFVNITLTFFVSRLIQWNYVKFIGGILIFWIAFRLFSENGDCVIKKNESQCLASTVFIIILSNITTSTDNMIAVAAASKGNLSFVISGLLVSIPIVFFASSMIVSLINKYPSLIIIAAALLGKLGGEMIITDPFIEKLLNPGVVMVGLTELLFAAGVIVAGKTYQRMRFDLTKR